MDLNNARVLILGMDGYLGWALYCHLRHKANAVAGLDNFSRRRHVNEIGSDSLFPLPPEKGLKCRPIHLHDLMFNPFKVQQFIESFQPTTIVHHPFCRTTVGSVFHAQQGFCGHHTTK
jgi:nucleoside-diphosphate-sugar epimerase